MPYLLIVALRKESVDRNVTVWPSGSVTGLVALRKESVDRNFLCEKRIKAELCVALRKESVDRNNLHCVEEVSGDTSLSARRAWIEIIFPPVETSSVKVSLSARRAWIEMTLSARPLMYFWLVALRKESVDRNVKTVLKKETGPSRSPQGERG